MKTRPPCCPTFDKCDRNAHCELAVCDRINALRFAPGSIERYRPRLGSPAQRRELLRWAVLLAVYGALLVVFGFAVGVISGRLP